MKEIILKKLEVYPPSKEFFCPIHIEIAQPAA
jgi:hypothetical protein